MRRAFSLVEMLTVIGIVALLSAILFPVFGAVRMRGRHTQTVNNLHQLGLAIALYRQEADGGGRDEGTPAQMGMPVPYEVMLKQLPYGISQCTSGRASEDSRFLPIHIVYLNAWPELWKDVTPIYHDNAIVLSAMCFSDPNVSLVSSFFDHHGIGLALAGNVRVVQKRGDWQRQAWWQP